MSGVVLQAVVGQQGAYSHVFGHDPALQGLVPIGQTVPAHLILTLDMSDPLLSWIGFTGSKLRLVHPYRYSQGADFVYRIADGGQTIVFIEPLAGLLQPPDDDWPSENYPTTLLSEAIALISVGLDDNS